jgi:hypothetical protein
MTSNGHSRVLSRSARLAAAALTAALVSTALSATPASAAPVTLPNPDLAPSCGLDVVLLLDASTSIPSSDEAKAAAKAVVGAFTNTSTRLGIVTFNASASAKLPLTLVTTDSIATGGAHEAAIASYRRASGTNWQDALIESNAMFAAAPARSGVQRLTVMISDGQPRNYNLPDGSPSALLPPSDPLVLDPAVDEANVFKSGGGHLLALGVGVGESDAALETFKAITDTAGQYSPMTPFDATTTDVVLTPDYTAVKADLAAVVSQLCAGSLTVTQRVTSASAPTTYGNGGAGWTVSATSTPGGGYIKPVTSANATVATTTDIGGTAVFQWAPGGSDWTRAISFSTTAKRNFALAGVTCTRNGAATSVSVVSGKVTVPAGVSGSTTIACIVRHKWTGPLTSTVTLAAGKRAADGGIRLSGSLSGPTSRLAGKQVTIQTRSPQATTWKSIAKKTTSSTGAFALTVRPTRNKEYRATFAGASSPRAYYSDVSKIVSVQIGASVYLKVSQTSVLKGQTVTFSGRVAPKKPGSSVLLQRKVGDTWTTVKTRALSSQSTYLFRVTPRTTRDYRWRVFKPADSRNSANFSSAVLVRVR